MIGVAKDVIKHHLSRAGIFLRENPPLVPYALPLIAFLFYTGGVVLAFVKDIIRNPLAWQRTLAKIKGVIVIRTRQNGFTLIELMIVVAVIGILAAIAYPSYREHVCRSTRTAAQNYLLDLAQRQELRFQSRRNYAIQTTDTLPIPVPPLPPALPGMPGEVAQRYDRFVIPPVLSTIATTAPAAGAPATFTMILRPVPASGCPYDTRPDGTRFDAPLIVDSNDNRYRDLNEDGAWTALVDKRWEER